MKKPHSNVRWLEGKDCESLRDNVKSEIRTSVGKQSNEVACVADPLGAFLHGSFILLPCLMNDFKFAIRQLIKSPGFALAVVAITAIGIGAVTLMYSVFWGVLLRPLPFLEPQRLVFVQATTDRGNPNSLSALDYDETRPFGRALFYCRSIEMNQQL
jgi:hypothetical protein